MLILFTNAMVSSAAIAASMEKLPLKTGLLLLKIIYYRKGILTERIPTILLQPVTSVMLLRIAILTVPENEVFSSRG